MASCFNILVGIWHTFFFSLHHMNLRDQPWKMFILWCRTDICSCKFSAKVSFMLHNPFLVPSLCKLNHISVCFIQISTKPPANSWFPSGKTMFFWSHPRCFGPLGKFQRFLLRRPVFPDYPFLMTVVSSISNLFAMPNLW